MVVSVNGGYQIISSDKPVTLNQGVLLILFPLQILLSSALIIYNLYKPHKKILPNYFTRITNILLIFNASIFISTLVSTTFIYQFGYIYYVLIAIIALIVVLCQQEILISLLPLQEDGAWLKSDHIWWLQRVYVILYIVCYIPVYMKIPTIGEAGPYDWYNLPAYFFCFMIVVYEEVHNIYTFFLLRARFTELMFLKTKVQLARYSNMANFGTSLNETEAETMTGIEIEGLKQLQWLLVIGILSDSTSFFLILYTGFFVTDTIKAIELLSIGIVILGMHVIFVSIFLYLMHAIRIKKSSSINKS